MYVCIYVCMYVCMCVYDYMYVLCMSYVFVVPKRFNKPWFSDICKEHNQALQRFKREPTEGNQNAYRIASIKNRRDIE